ncbi:hypothetical protein FOCC_FOCC001895 [Frankliniella occidentalis]|nr:hypothetical protein FOCC_FOCC001895 [Frankliniella occidentalis]
MLLDRPVDKSQERSTVLPIRTALAVFVPLFRVPYRHTAFEVQRTAFSPAGPKRRFSLISPLFVPARRAGRSQTVTNPLQIHLVTTPYGVSLFSAPIQ